MQRIKRALTSGLVVSTAAGFIAVVTPGTAAAASACTSSPGVERICLSPKTATNGDTVQVHGVEFQYCPDGVRVYFGGAPSESVTPEVSNGTFDAGLEVPAQFSPGPHTVEANCLGEGIYAQASLTVTEPDRPDPPELRLSTAKAAPGGSVGVRGAHFRCESFAAYPAPTVSIVLAVGGTERPLGSATPDEDGDFSSTVTVPSDVAAGSYSVTGRCGGSTAGANLTVIVPPPPSPTTTPPSPSPTWVSPTPTTSDTVSPTYPSPTVAPELTSQETGGASDLLGGLVALIAAVLVGQGIRTLKRRPDTEPVARVPVLDAVLVGSAGPPPALRETGSGHTVALSVIPYAAPGTQTVTWRDEGGAR